MGEGAIFYMSGSKTHMSSNQSDSQVEQSVWSDQSSSVQSSTRMNQLNRPTGEEYKYRVVKKGGLVDYGRRRVWAESETSTQSRRCLEKSLFCTTRIFWGTRAECLFGLPISYTILLHHQTNRQTRFLIAPPSNSRNTCPIPSPSSCKNRKKIFSFLPLQPVHPAKRVGHPKLLTNPHRPRLGFPWILFFFHAPCSSPLTNMCCK